MSKQVTISGHIYWLQRKWEKQGIFTFVDCDMSAMPDYTKVIPHSFTVEIPDDFDPIPGRVEAIKKQQQELKAAFAKKMMELDSDLANLLCIESGVAA